MDTNEQLIEQFFDKMLEIASRSAENNRLVKEATDLLRQWIGEVQQLSDKVGEELKNDIN